jgi:hypothetical protein
MGRPLAAAASTFWRALQLAMRRSDVPLEDHPGPDLESRNLGSRHGTGVRSLGSDTPAPFGLIRVGPPHFLKLDGPCQPLPIALPADGSGVN